YLQSSRLCVHQIDCAIERLVTLTNITAIVQYDIVYLNPGVGFKSPCIFPRSEMQLAFDSPRAKQPPQNKRALQTISLINPVIDRQADQMAYAMGLSEVRFRTLPFPNRDGGNKT